MPIGEALTIARQIAAGNRLMDTFPHVPAALWHQLSTVLPTMRQTLFLRACLHEGNAASQAFQQWERDATREGASINHTLAAMGRMLPLLWWSAGQNAFEMDSRLATSLRCAHLTEDLRWRTYRSVCRSTFECLRDADVPFIALKGAALAETAYPSPLARHTGDIDVLLHSSDLDRAADSLLRLGWRWSSSSSARVPYIRHLPPLVHRCGLPLELHDCLLIPHYTLPYRDFWVRSRSATLMGTDARVLCPADSLLHVITHGLDEAMNGLLSPQWVADAWFILDRHPDLDWSVFVASATAGRLGLPVFIALRYLSTEMNARVPSTVLEDVKQTAIRCGFRDRAAARLYARPWRVGTIREIWSGPGSPWQRLGALWRRAFPPPVEAALRFDLRLWQVPFFYVSRFARFARASTSAQNSHAATRFASNSPITLGVSRISRPKSSQ